jgi:tetratricopeptide (TPR) repeat protein
MLRKSLAIASLIILNTASVSWSLELAGSRRPPSRTEQKASLAALFGKLSTAIENERYPEAERIARQILRQDPSNRAAFMFLNTALTEQQKFAEAESLAYQRIAAYPLDFQAYEQLGSRLAQQGKLEAALTIYRQAVASNPANSYIDLMIIHHNIVATLVEMNRQDEAIAFARQRLATSSSRGEIIGMGYQLSSIFQKQNRNDEAITVLREVIAREPGDLRVYSKLGELLLDQGKESEAIEIYQQAVALPQDMFMPDPQSNEIYSALGTLLEKQKRQAEALALYRKIIANSRMPSLNFSQPEEIREGLLSLQGRSISHGNSLTFGPFPILGAQIAVNELLYEQQGWTAVLQEMRPIGQTTPEIAAFIFQKFGDRRMAAKQYNEAITAYQQALTVDKEAINVYTSSNLFLAWTFTNQPLQAQVAYQQTLKLTSANKRQETIERWAYILDKGGRKAEAIALYRQLLKTPGKKSLFLSLQLAKALQQSGQTTEANQIYQQIQANLDRLKRTAPQDPNTHIMQGNLYSQLEQRQLAIDSYRRAIELLAKQPEKDPKQLSFSQLKLADNLRLMSQHPEAIAAYRQALEGCECTELKAYSPSTLHGMAYYGMGLSLQQQGNLADARAAWKKAVDVDPDYEEARRAIDQQ